MALVKVGPVFTGPTNGSMKQEQLFWARPPVLAHVLFPAEPESFVRPHEDGFGFAAEHPKFSSENLRAIACLHQPGMLDSGSLLRT